MKYVIGILLVMVVYTFFLLVMQVKSERVFKINGGIYKCKLIQSPHILRRGH